jgi:hypothetical protein
VNVDRKQAEGKIQGRDGNPAIFLPTHPYTLVNEPSPRTETQQCIPKRSENDQFTIPPPNPKVGGKIRQNRVFFCRT